MADEKDKVTQTTAKTASDWVESYYGDDAIDQSKKNKIRHIIRTGQYASVIYVISKNSKKAHTDFFDETYATLDLRYSKAAEIIVKLLSVMYKEGRPLTPDDFKACGGEDMFGSSANYDQICQDYIGPGGMVEMCDMACFPRPKVQDLLEGKETPADYKLLPDYEKQRRICKKMGLLYGSFVEDLEDVKTHHAELIVTSGSDNGTLSADFLKEVLYKTKDKGSKMQRELKGKISALDFTIKDDIEKNIGIHYDFTKKTGKLALLGGATTASLGLIAGGAFWPAFMVIPIYALAKKWIPAWFETLGKEWGHFEKSMGHRYEQRKVNAYYRYMQSFMETDGHPKIRLRDRIFLHPRIIKCLKKGSKSGMVTSSFEGTDGKYNESELERAMNPIFSKAYGKFVNDSEMHPVDSGPVILDAIKQIDALNTNLEQFNQIANRVKKVCDKFPETQRQEILDAYASKLLECAPTLIFRNNFKTGTDYQDKISQFLKDDYTILEVLKGYDPNTIAKVKRFVTFASKELTGLDDKYIGGPLEDYIMRVPTPKMDIDGSGLVLLENGAVEYDFSAYAGDKTHITNALNLISNLQLNPSDDREFIVAGTSKKVSDITKEIALVQAPAGTTDNVALKAAEDARDKLNKALNKQMKMVVYSKQRADSRASYDAVLIGHYAGKLPFDETFKKFSEINYENVETFSGFYFDMEKTEPKEVREYIKGKFGKQVYDIMKAYAGQNIEKFKSDLKALSEYMKKVNNNQFLNQQQKMELSASVSPCVEKAFGNTISDLSDTFVQGYDTNFFADCLKSYEKGGFAELFESDQSANTQMLRMSFEYMRDMQDVYNSLKLNDQFDLNKEEAKYIAKTLLTDRTTGEPPKLKTRISGTDVDLVEFIINKIKSMSTSFGTDVDKDNLTSKQPYKDLEDALREAKNLPDGTDYQKYDKYTALLILKNKCISMFRLCMKDFVQGHYTGSRSVWIDGHGPLINEIKTIWENGIMKQIDDELKAVTGIKKYAGNSTVSEISKYGTGSEVESMITQRQL